MAPCCSLHSAPSGHAFRKPFIGSAINQATRQIGSVKGVAFTVLLLSGASLQRVDFDAVYLCHANLTRLTAAFYLPVNTLPTVTARKA